MNTLRIQTGRFTKPINPMTRSMRTASLLDSLQRAFRSAFRLYTSGNQKLVALARLAMQAVRRNAATLFGDTQIAEAFLMGGY